MKRFTLCVFLTAACLSYLSAESDYVIKKNDTLYSISRQFGVSVQDLIAYNHISDPRKLKKGTTIQIPSRYTVKKRDTLYGIARSHSITVKELCSLNGIQDSHVLKVGDVLIVPGEPEQLFRGETEAATRVSIHTEPFFWPHEGERETQSGKLNGAHIYGRKGDPIYAIASGEVVWSGPYRGFGQVVLIQSSTGYVYIYGGNEEILVNVGDRVIPGTTLGTIGMNPHNGKPGIFFSIFKDGKPVDLEKAPRI